MKPVQDILAAAPQLFVDETSDPAPQSSEEPPKRSFKPDSTPGSPTYDWETYGYSLITEETFEGGYHKGDYEKDGVIYCGYCHTPKQVLHEWQGKLRAFPVNCRCKRECMRRIAEERAQRQKLEEAEKCRHHALPYTYMHQWTFAHDDGGSPKATQYFKHYVDNFEEMQKEGNGLFLFGPKSAGKTYAAAQIVNALCDKGYRCLVTSFMEIVKNLLSLNRENRQQYLDDICNHDLLVFDDFGGETNSNFFDINLEEIVKTCYMKYIPMIVITPMAQDTLEQGLNATRQKAIDRMKERCYCLTLRNTKRNRQITRERKEKMEKLLGIGEE